MHCCRAAWRLSMLDICHASPVSLQPIWDETRTATQFCCMGCSTTAAEQLPGLAGLPWNVMMCVGGAAFVKVRGGKSCRTLADSGAVCMLHICHNSKLCTPHPPPAAPQTQLAASTATWKLVMLHHSPFSSGSNHGSIARLQWPYQTWGADAVLSGHDHLYERILAGSGFPYMVNGLGGASILASTVVAVIRNLASLSGGINASKRTFFTLRLW